MSKRRLIIGGEEVVTPAESLKSDPPAMTPAESAQSNTSGARSDEPSTYAEVRDADRVAKNRFVLKKLLVEKLCPVCLRGGFSIRDSSSIRKTILCSCGAHIEVYIGKVSSPNAMVREATVIVDETMCQPQIAIPDPEPSPMEMMQTLQDGINAQVGIPASVIRSAISEQAAVSPRSRNGQTQHRETDNVLIAKFLSRLVCPDCTGKQILTRRTNSFTTKFMCQDCPMTIELEWTGDIAKDGPKVRRLNEE